MTEDAEGEESTSEEEETNPFFSSLQNLVTNISRRDVTVPAYIDILIQLNPAITDFMGLKKTIRYW